MSTPFPWKPLSLADAYTLRPPAPWIVEGLFRSASLNLVFGPPGSLKSLLLLDLCACVAAGRPWLEPESSGHVEAFKVRQGPTAYIDFDNGEETSLNRLEAVGRAHKLSSAPIFLTSMATPWLDLTNQGGPPYNPNRVSHADQLADWIAAIGGTLVVLDNLGTISGTADENSNEMVQVMAALRKVANSTKAAIVVIHHPTKADNSIERGHGGIKAALDLALSVKREQDTVTVECTKARHAEPDPFAARFDYLSRLDSPDLATARFWGVPAAVQSLDRQVRAAILDILQQQGSLNQSQVLAEVNKRMAKVSLRRVRTALDYLVHRGLVSETPGPIHNAHIYAAVPMRP